MPRKTSYADQVNFLNSVRPDHLECPHWCPWGPERPTSRLSTIHRRTAPCQLYQSTVRPLCLYKPFAVPRLDRRAF